jgi:hypothetical protein
MSLRRVSWRQKANNKTHCNEILKMRSFLRMKVWVECTLYSITSYFCSFVGCSSFRQPTSRRLTFCLWLVWGEWLGHKLYSKISVDKTSVEKMSVNKTPVDEMSLGEMSVDEMAVDKMTCCRFITKNQTYLMFCWFSQKRLKNILGFLGLDKVAI